MVTTASFPFSLRSSARGSRIKLIWAPESRSALPCLCKPSAPRMSVSTIGNIVSWLFSTDATPTMTGWFAACRRGWWKYLHWFPLILSEHCRLLEQVEALWSLPARFKQQKQAWFSFTVFSRSLGLIEVNLEHWSTQWLEFWQIQHLCGLDGRLLLDIWLTVDLGCCWLVFLSGAVALILDFISVVIHATRFSKVACWQSLSRWRDHTLRSSMHILCSIMANIWLLSMSCGRPTSLSVLKLRFTKCTNSQKRASSPSRRGLNLETSWVTVSATNLGSP